MVTPDRKSLLKEIEGVTIDKALYLLVITLPAALIMGLIRAYQSGVTIHIYFYFIFYAFLLISWFARKPLPNSVKYGIVTAVFVLSGSVSILTWGIVGVGPIFFFTALIFSILSRNRLLLGGALGILFSVLVLSGRNVFSNIEEYGPRFKEYASAPTSWIIFLIVLLLLSLISGFSIYVFQKKLNELVDDFVGAGKELEENKEALEKEKEQTEEFLEMLPGIFFLYNSNHELIRWNRNHSILTGYSEAELHNKKPRNWFDDENWVLIASALEELDSKGESNVKANVKMKSGELVPYMFTAKSIKLEDGIGFCGHGIDISEQYTLETQVQQNQKMDALGALAGGIAHDFNNILNGFYGFLQLMEMHKTPEKQIFYRGEIRKLADRAKDLVTQILSFSRKGEVKKEVTDVGNLVNEISQFLKASIPSTISLEYQIPDEPVRVMGDPTQIHQILLNLCTNGYHAMKEGGGTLGMYLSTEELTLTSPQVIAGLVHEGEYAVVEVKDTGSGIPPEILDKIFEPFFTTKEKGEGTGMGLSVVHSIIREHGGAIEVKSIPGEGTSFFVRIPITYETAIPDSESEDDYDANNEGTKILFVDDEEIAHKVFPPFFKQMGYNVVSAIHGKEALDKFKEESGFDIVISDQTMPELSGLKLVKELRALSYKGPFILLSGFSDEQITKNDLGEFGVTTYLRKPIRPSELAHKVGELL